MTAETVRGQVARALLRQQTNGLCDLSRVCDSCDCFAHVDGGKGRDARVLAEASDLLATLRSPEVLAGIAGVLAERANGHPDDDDYTEDALAVVEWLAGGGRAVEGAAHRGLHLRHLA